ncbi:MAG: protease HtpX [Pseudomonadota bacterium]|nr:protease HtpX [Pseudomonadota bacterium]
MLRILLFLATNMAIVLALSVTMQLLGVPHYLEGSGINYQSLLIFSLVLGFAGSFISLFLSKWMAKSSTRTRIIEQPETADEQWLVATVEELAEKAGIGMPEVGIMPMQQANAFATGWNKNNALVAVSQGMLQRFSKDEIRAVMGHEIGHVANGDMVTLTLIQGVVNTFVIFFARIIGNIVDQVVFKNENGRGFGYFIAVFVAEIILGFLASAIVLWFSRRREFRADEAGALLGGKQGMINALKRLQIESGQVPNQMPDTMTAFAINTGKVKKDMSRLFMSHPPLEERIQALEAMKA